MKTLQQILRQILQLVSSLKCNIYGMIDPREIHEFRYVGKTPYSLDERLYYHIWEATQKGKNKVKTYKCNWIRKLLRDNTTPVIVLIDVVPLFQWKYWEKHYIKLYKNLGHRLTNATEGGEGVLGCVWSEEHRRKVCKALSGENNYLYGKTWEEAYGAEKAKEMRKKQIKRLTGKKQSEESNKKRSKSLSGKNNPMFGKHHAAEANEKNRQSHLGKHPSKETLLKMSKALKGITLKDRFGIEKANEIKRKALIGNTNALGSKHTEEANRKRSESVKESWKKRKTKLIKAT